MLDRHHPSLRADLPDHPDRIRPLASALRALSDDPLINSADRYGSWKQPIIPDVIAFGCSVTAGDGLPRRFTWPAIAQQITGLRIALCARRGSSVAFQLSLVAEQIATSGIPKQMIGLLPNLDRAWLPRADETVGIVGDHYQHDPVQQIYLPSQDLRSVLAVRGSRRKDRGSEAIAPSLIVWQTLQALQTWTYLADAIQIDLRISSWHRQTLEALQDFASSVTIPSYEPTTDPIWSIDLRWGDPASRNCGHTPANSEQAQVWEIGSDRWHPGLHHQIHFCEHLLQIQISQEQVATL